MYTMAYIRIALPNYLGGFNTKLFLLPCTWALNELPA